MNVVRPGTMIIKLSTGLFDIVMFEDARAEYMHKVRRCILHKTRFTSLDTQWSDPEGHLLTIISKAIFDDLCTVLTEAGREIQVLEREVNNYSVQLESYKMTLETLRKNGVID